VGYKVLEIRKSWDEHTKTYIINLLNNNQAINIYFAGNLDLYWSYYDNEPFNFDSINSKKTFEVTKENYFLYSLFDQLYNDIDKCNIYPADLEDSFTDFNERQEIAKMNSAERNMLFKNDTIKWLSDEAPEEDANSFTIFKSEESFIVTFIQKYNMFTHYAVRISNSGSRYNPFNILFMRMFNELQKHDDTYHQIHIEEYMYQKKIGKTPQNHN
jgi:hypothetical protein